MKEIYFKDVPSHRKVPNSKIIVDFFKFNVIDSSHSFLTHFHADHYNGISTKFDQKIYCSETTANLLKLFYNITNTFIMEYNIFIKLYDDVYVKAIDANHCPGAISLIFKIKNSYYYHTGDFRYNNSIHNIKDIVFNDIFLDNTFLHKNTPKQEDVIIRTIDEIKKRIYNKNILIPFKYKILFGTYLIGKEKLVLSVCDYFKWKIYVDKRKMNILKCYSEYDISRLNDFVYKMRKYIYEKENINNNNKKFDDTIPFSLFTENIQQSDVEIIQMANMNAIKLNKKYIRMKEDRILFICGTGWKDGNRFYNLTKNNRQIKKGIEFLYLPYSEHSSKNELEEFINSMKYNSIIFTVNVNKYK
ncbi:YSH1 exonuclease of the beta-lactamase fold protein [Spraguea lophii 42_110]|uniref:YSH1 exonuclease of the beta-lactamase fold protein n=1 Tax=Spraguea lophii (strain 42_110) TaxID=1358809 RepID=S7W683_SPRLO|nr:YSH1 exonuclease of the beta-lactamase fold protein [Spraguea lophii 42_110]